MRYLTATILGLSTLAVATASNALELGFKHIDYGLNPSDSYENGKLLNGRIGERQFSVKVNQYDSRNIELRFLNQGRSSANITNLYIDDNDRYFAGIAGLLDRNETYTGQLGDNGVDFQTAFPFPRYLPNARYAGFVGGNSLKAGAAFPTMYSGINTGEGLGVLLKLRQGVSVHQAIRALVKGVFNPHAQDAVRVGVFAQDFNTNPHTFGNQELQIKFVRGTEHPGESFVTGRILDYGDKEEPKPTPVPEPLTVLGALAAIGIGAKFKRAIKK